MRSTRHPRRAASWATGALLGVLLAGALSACGSGSSTVALDPAPSSPTTGATVSTSPPPTGPVCAHVWKSGSTLPTGYRGCAAQAGWVKAQVYQCEDGHHVVTFAHVYYATPGRSISRAATTLAKDHEFRHTMAACGA